MDIDVIDRLYRIKLTLEEGKVIIVRPDRRNKSLEECSLSLFRKLLAPRPLNLRFAKNLLRSVWKMGLNLKIIEVGDGLLQFKFALESQVSWVMNNEPWSFDNKVLVLKRWERGMTARLVTFTNLPIWVQIWGLPFDLINVEAGLKIRNSLGQVVEVEALTKDQAHFLRVRVVTSLDKPIRRGGSIVNPEGDKTWIVFRYEWLCGLCFKCGKIGHEAKECNVQVTEGEELPYGDWLKAGFQRRASRSGGSTENRTGNDPTNTPFAQTGETNDDRVPPNSHKAAGVSTNTNQHVALIEDNVFFDTNDILADFLAITRFLQENMTEWHSQDPIPTALKVDVTPKETSSTLGPADIGRVISEMTATHSGLFNVPISYMQPAIDPIGLDGKMHDKGNCAPTTNSTYTRGILCKR